MFASVRLDPKRETPDHDYAMCVSEAACALISTTHLGILLHLQFLELPFIPLMGLQAALFLLFFATGILGLIVALPVRLANRIIV